MSAPVDVLAVMERVVEDARANVIRYGDSFYSESIRHHTNAHYVQVAEARAAVAELVEAAKRAKLMLSVSGPMCGIHAGSETVSYDDAECDGYCVSEDCAHAELSLSFALAKFGGAA